MSNPREHKDGLTKVEREENRNKTNKNIQGYAGLDNDGKGNDSFKNAERLSNRIDDLAANFFFGGPTAEKHNPKTNLTESVTQQIAQPATQPIAQPATQPIAQKVDTIIDEIGRLNSADELLDRKRFSKYGIYFDCVIGNKPLASGVTLHVARGQIYKNTLNPTLIYEFEISNQLDKNNKPISYVSHINDKINKIMDAGQFNNYMEQLKKMPALKMIYNDKLIDKYFNKLENSDSEVIHQTLVKIKFNSKYEFHPPLFYDEMFQKVITEIKSCDPETETETESELCKFLSTYQHTDSGGARRRKKSGHKKSGHKKSQNKKPRITRRHKRTRASHKK